MMPRTILISAALAASLAASTASAQDGAGGGPSGTVTAPNKSPVGQTKPPAGGAGAATADAPHDRRTQDQDDKISRGICIGCGPK